MLRIVIACALASLALGATLPDDATLTAEFLGWSGRIVGGQTANPGDFPYQVSCRTTANGHFCGGFIINSRWVGSAAHCTINRTPTNMIVVVGAINRITGGTSMAVARVVNHPNYHAPTTTQDVSVVQTVNPILFSAHVGPIPLGANVNLGTGAGPYRAVGSGWGQTSHPGSAAANLQFVNVEIISNVECRARLSTAQAARIIDSTICSSSPSGSGMCMGDSGGPLTHNGEIVGAVSWGVPCGGAAPDMFARIASFRDWFLQTIET